MTISKPLSVVLQLISLFLFVLAYASYAGDNPEGALYQGLIAIGLLYVSRKKATT